MFFCLGHHLADCGAAILRYVLRNQFNQSDEDMIIQTYKMMFRSMSDKAMDSVHYNTSLKHMNFMMDNERLKEKGKFIMDILKDNVLSIVCPLPFDLRFKHHQEESKVSALSNQYSIIKGVSAIEASNYV